MKNSNFWDWLIEATPALILLIILTVIVGLGIYAASRRVPPPPPERKPHPITFDINLRLNPKEK